MKQKGLTNRQIAAFCAEMAMLLTAGYPPYDAALALWEDDEDAFAVPEALLSALSAGEPLSAALRASGMFPLYAASMTEAGEKTGRQTEALRTLSAYYESREQMAQAVRDAVVYPSALFLMMSAVVVILTVKVLPVFADAYARLGASLPPSALALMRAGGWMERAALAAAVIVVLLLAGVLAARWSLVVRSAFLSLFWRVAGDRGLFKRMAAARYLSVLSMGLSSGLPYVESAAAAEDTLGILCVKRYRDCRTLLRDGSTPADALCQTGILSAADKRRLAAGTRSGMADRALADIAARCERDAREALARAVGLIEPVLVIGASVMVGLVILSVMLPLMSVMNTIG